MLKNLARWALHAAPVILLAVAVTVLWRELATLDLAAVGHQIAAWGPWRIAAAAAAAFASYALLAAMEWFGLRWAGAKVPFGDVLVGSFCANAFAHTIGFAVIVGGAVRARLYARSGATLMMVAQTTLFCSAAFGFGISLFAGLALVLKPNLPIMGLALHPGLGATLGVVLVAMPLAYILACALIRRPIKIAGREATLPPPGLAAVQVLLGFVDIAVSAAVVWTLLDGSHTSFTAFAGPFSVATVAGLVSSVPGGAGVFEGSLLALLPDLARAPLAAALVGYRLIYYVVPLLLAGLILMRLGLAPAGLLGQVRTQARVWAPTILAIAAFVLGATLILTGVGRIDPDRLKLLRETVPVVLLETSHLISLVSGIGLMGASLMVVRRHATAVPVVVVASLVGASTALLRGLDIGPAVAAGGLAVVTLVCRKAFDRRGGGKIEQLLPIWLAGVVAVFLGAGALGLWVYADTPYEARLWAQVGYHADPSRFLRTIALTGAGLLAVGVFVLARTAGASAEPASNAELDAIRALVEAEPDTTARLALTGDKALLRSEAGDAFMMYGAQGRSLIAMGDPVGSVEAGEALLWRFKERADGMAARPVIYHASTRWLVAYLDLGLSLLKLGEEARVPLATFSLEGSARAKLRQGHAKAVREGLSFEVVPPPQSARLLSELQVISDAWLLSHGVREKGFSLGRFDPRTLVAEPMALVRHEGRVVGFANIWTGGTVEASVDLMRYLPDAPHGVMDFLFIELMQWAKGQGFEWFNLGMAPLSGLADHPLAPTWAKIGAEVARRGGRFYGFAGLRAFKAKFDPVWTPRYIAAPPTALAAALLDATRLVARAPPVPPVENAAVQRAVALGALSEGT